MWCGWACLSLCIGCKSPEAPAVKKALTLWASAFSFLDEVLTASLELQPEVAVRLERFGWVQFGQRSSQG
jgi:hypothetical protein